MAASLANLAGAETPERAYARQQCQLLLWREVGRLPGRQPALIVLRYAHGLTLDNIAEVFDVGVSAVHAMHARACRNLRIRLSGMGIDGGSIGG